MYKIIYTSSAKKDLEEIINYISNKLNNKNAANELIKKIKKEEKSILIFPHANARYISKSKLEFDYRRAIVGNYSMFYTIDKSNKKIYVARIIYNKRELEKVLD